MRLLILAVIALCNGCFRVVAPPAKVEPVTTAGDFPYALYDAVFAEHVTSDGLIDYAAVRDDRAAKLDLFLGHIARTSPTSHPGIFPTDAHALAFYLNAYNAIAVQAVLDRPEISTVDAIKVNFFYTTRYRIGGDKVSLYTLENGIIRKRFEDPRIHFFLNCQSASCPPFPAVAVRPETLDETLDSATRAFVQDEAHVRALPDGSVAVSSIFKWYAGDFGGANGILPYIRQYRDELPESATVTFLAYDWALIAKPGRGPGD